MWIQKNRVFIKYPIRLNLDKANKRDKCKFYQFHDDYSYTTDECRNLKDKIERLIQKGALRKFTQIRKDERVKL